jgi:hypothetical protein
MPQVWFASFVATGIADISFYGKLTGKNVRTKAKMPTE